MASTRPGTQHRDLLAQAKQQQSVHLKDASSASTQLVRAVDALIKHHSSAGTQSMAPPPLLDKIATIHELDREIDRQLSQDIVHNFEALVQAKKKLAVFVKHTQRSLAISPSAEGSYVDVLQHRVELVDQELRILETALRLVDSNSNA